jgi:hypothetical protein
MKRGTEWSQAEQRRTGSGGRGEPKPNKVELKLDRRSSTADVVKRAEHNVGQLKPEQCTAVLGGGNESKADRAQEGV